MVKLSSFSWSSFVWFLSSWVICPVYLLWSHNWYYLRKLNCLITILWSFRITKQIKVFLLLVNWILLRTRCWGNKQKKKKEGRCFIVCFTNNSVVLMYLDWSVVSSHGRTTYVERVLTYADPKHSNERRNVTTENDNFLFQAINFYNHFNIKTS